MNFNNKNLSKMKSYKKIKLQDLVDKSAKINVNEMQKIVGGNSLLDGCTSRVCSSAVVTALCNGASVCTTQAIE
jgi:natural product precursor